MPTILSTYAANSFKPQTSGLDLSPLPMASVRGGADAHNSKDNKSLGSAFIIRHAPQRSRAFVRAHTHSETRFAMGLCLVWRPNVGVASESSSYIRQKQKRTKRSFYYTASSIVEGGCWRHMHQLMQNVYRRLCACPAGVWGTSQCHPIHSFEVILSRHLLAAKLIAAGRLR